MKRKLLWSTLLLSVLFASTCVALKEVNRQSTEALLNRETIKRVKDTPSLDEKRNFSDRDVIITLSESFSKEIDSNGISALKTLEKTSRNLCFEKAKRIGGYNRGDRLTFIVPLKSPSKENVVSALKALSSDEKIFEACLNETVKLQSLSSGDMTNEQWPIVTNLSSNIGVVNAWNVTEGKERVRVGVIDTGVKRHIDLLHNVDYDLGYDFLNDEAITDEVDSNDHGTAVSGVIAARRNGSGIDGIAPNVTIVPLQCGFNTSDQWDEVDVGAVIQAIRYATDLWGTDKQISVLNYSVGGFGKPLYDENGAATGYKFLLDAIKEFPGLFVWAAGNENLNLDDLTYVSEYFVSNIVCVGGFNEDSTKVASSNYGFAVDVFAPGSSIKTTVGTEDYGFTGGTSLAAPFVSATAALLYSKYPNITASKVKEAIHSGSYYHFIDTANGFYQVKFLKVDSILNYASQNASSDPAYLRIGIDSKNGNSWNVSFINDNEYDVHYVWNKKTCSLYDAKELSNLSDIAHYTIPALGKMSLPIEQNGSAPAIVAAIVQRSGSYGKRYISYTDGLVQEGNDCKSNRVYNKYQRVTKQYADASSLSNYPQYLSLAVVGSSGWLFPTAWTIAITNNSNKSLTVEYNSKMCFEGDARAFSGLSDISTVTIAANQTKNVQINTNYFADFVVASAVFSYDGIDVRRVTYAKDLSTSPSIGVNRHSEILYLKNGPVVQNTSN